MGHRQVNCEKLRAWKAAKGNGAVAEQPNVITKQHKASHVSQRGDDDHYAFLRGCTEQAEKQWIWDSDATCHIANYRTFFNDLDDAVIEDVWVASGTKVRSKGRWCWMDKCDRWFWSKA